MKVLSIDVGIKNLAFCLFDKSSDSDVFTVTKWDSVNICEATDIAKCGFVDKKGACTAIAKYRKNDLCFCLKHSKKQKYDIPVAELKPTNVKKLKIQKLCELADKYNVVYDKPIKKDVLVSLVNDHVHKNCFQEILVANASKVDLINVGRNIKHKFDALFDNEMIIDYVVIENQISPIAIRMKTIQGMLAQYFIMCNVAVDKIEFVSAANKLGDCPDEEKSTYKDRKRLGIKRCIEIMTTDNRFGNKFEYFDTHKKKDDLADAFLQGVWFIKSTFLKKVEQKA